MGAALDREGLSLSISSEHGSCPRARSTCHAPWPGLQRYSLDHLIVALEEVGPALRAQVERGLHVLVNVHVGHVVKVLLASTQSLIHKLWGHRHRLFLLFLGLLVSCRDREGAVTIPYAMAPTAPRPVTYLRLHPKYT